MLPTLLAGVAKEAGVYFDNTGRVGRAIMLTIDGKLLPLFCLFVFLTYLVGKEVPYFVSEKGVEIESRNININHDTRGVKSVDSVLAGYKPEFDDQPRCAVSPLSL